MVESYAGKINRKLNKKIHIIDVAAGREKADLVLKNASYVNVFSKEILTCDIAVTSGLIVGFGEYEGIEELDLTGKIVIPGFVDAHIHLESSLTAPWEFARAVLPHGTTTVITDPHEITNVMGENGIEYILEATEGLPVDVRVMIPSCVPATPQDESGCILDYHAVDSFYEHPRIQGLAEMMNFPGIIASDRQTVEKIVAAQAHHKKIDGHAPGLRGKDLSAYCVAGIYTDHECSDVEDALEKLRMGQFIMIREGTAARNLKALLPLITEQYADRIMFCCDDKHPSDLLEKGHIDYIVREAIRAGADPLLTIRTATHTAARYMQLNNRGAIAPGYLADLVVIDNFEDFNIERVYRKGKLMYADGKVTDFEKPEIMDYLTEHAHDTFHLPKCTAEDFRSEKPLGVIGMVPGEIVTTNEGFAQAADPEKDLLKMAVVERHKNTGHIGLGYLKGYGLKEGAVATSISHDSHNIIAVGVKEEDMALAVNTIAEHKGGIVVVKDGIVQALLELPIAGLMSEEPLTVVNDKLEAAKAAARELGVTGDVDPFMTLSFMSLTVIPTLRLSTRGVFDVMTQKLIG